MHQTLRKGNNVAFDGQSKCARSVGNRSVLSLDHRLPFCVPEILTAFTS